MENIQIEHPNYKSRLNCIRPNVYDGYMLGCDMIHGYESGRYNISQNKCNIPKKQGTTIALDITSIKNKNEKKSIIYKGYIDFINNAANKKNIPFIKINESNAINLGGVVRDMSLNVGDYIKDKFMFSNEIAESPECTMPNQLSNERSPTRLLNGGYSKVSKIKRKSIKQYGGSNSSARPSPSPIPIARRLTFGNEPAPPSPPSPTTLPSPTTNNMPTNSINVSKEKHEYNMYMQHFDVDKLQKLSDQDRNDLIKLLGYFAFVMSRVNKPEDTQSQTGLSLGINFSNFTLLMLFNFFEQRASIKLSKLFEDVLKQSRDVSGKSYLKTEFDENDVPLPYDPKKRLPEFLELDKKIEKIIGIFLALNELNDQELTTQTFNYTYINNPIDELIGLINPFLYSDKTQFTQLMGKSNLDHESPYYAIEDIMKKLKVLETFSDQFLNSYKYFFEIPEDKKLATVVYFDNINNKTDITDITGSICVKDIGECISESGDITLDGLLSVLEFRYVVGVSHTEAEKALNIVKAEKALNIVMNFLEKHRNDKKALIAFVKYITGTITPPSKIIINFTNGYELLFAHTCFRTLDISVKGNKILMSQLENIINETEGFTARGGTRKKMSRKYNKKHTQKQRKTNKHKF